MALYGIARLAVVVVAATPGVGTEPGTPAETDIYYFRVNAGFYHDTIATATGITEVALTKAPGKALTPVKELIRAGVLNTAIAIAKASDNKLYRIKLHYADAKDATVGTDILGKTILGTVSNAKSKGATFQGLVNTTRVTSRS